MSLAIAWMLAVVGPTLGFYLGRIVGRLEKKRQQPKRGDQASPAAAVESIGTVRVEPGYLELTSSIALAKEIGSRSDVAVIYWARIVPAPAREPGAASVTDLAGSLIVKIPAKGMADRLMEQLKQSIAEGEWNKCQ